MSLTVALATQMENVITEVEEDECQFLLYVFEFAFLTILPSSAEDRDAIMHATWVTTEIFVAEHLERDLADKSIIDLESVIQSESSPRCLKDRGC